MGPRSFCLPIAACFIGACAQMPGALPPPSPPPGAKVLQCDAACTVQVSVKCDAYVFCSIEPDNDWIRVGPGKSPVITWELMTSGYRFSDGGIAFPAASPFTCQAEGNRRFMCNDRHSEKGTYKYTITVIGFPFVLPKDPWVENQ
jgi:hypothetical protein